MTRMVQCVRLGRRPRACPAPYPGELGKRIYENVSKEAWQEWLRHQTMLINEYRLTPWSRAPASSWRRRWRTSSSVTAPPHRRTTSPSDPSTLDGRSHIRFNHRPLAR